MPGEHLVERRIGFNSTETSGCEEIFYSTSFLLTSRLGSIGCRYIAEKDLIATLQASEQSSAQLEEDKKHLEFMNSIKK